MDKKPIERVLEEWVDDGIPDIIVCCVEQDDRLKSAKRALVNKLARRYILTARRDGFIDRDQALIMTEVVDSRSKYDIYVRVINTEDDQRYLLFQKLIARFIRDCKDHGIFGKDQDVLVSMYQYKQRGREDREEC